MRHDPPPPPVIFDMGEPPEYRCDMAVKTLRKAVSDAAELFGREVALTLIIDEMNEMWRRVEARENGH